MQQATYREPHDIARRTPLGQNECEGVKEHKKHIALS
jgi:hypothetical protein